MDRLTVSEAADRLGISEDAVRTKVQRGTLPHAKMSDGQVYVYVDPDENTAKQESATGPIDETTLNYIDKLYNAWQTIHDAYKRCTFWALAASVLILALSGGAIATEDKFTVSGIGLRIPFVVLMTTGAILLAILLNTGAALELLKQIYERKIRNLYKSLGLDDATMRPPIDPFILFGVPDALGYVFMAETPDLDDDSHTVRESELVGIRGGLINIFLLVTLPTAAQAAAGYKISHVLDPSRLGWLSDIHVYLWLLPQQGSSWVSNLFIDLVVATAIMSGWHSARLSGDTKPVRVAAYVIALGFAYAGIWLGHFVAVR